MNKNIVVTEEQVKDMVAQLTDLLMQQADNEDKYAYMDVHMEGKFPSITVWVHSSVYSDCHSYRIDLFHRYASGPDDIRIINEFETAKSIIIEIVKKEYSWVR